MDIIDRYDLAEILADPAYRLSRHETHAASSPLIDRLERFFCVELPERERDRAAARQPHADMTVSTPAAARPRRAGLGLVFSLTLAACGAPGDDMSADDAKAFDAGTDGDGGIDADQTQPDGAPGPDSAPGDLPFNAVCDPLAEQCAAGLTCRLTSFTPISGNCRVVGAVGEAGACALVNGDGDCGATMACFDTPSACYILCDRADPTDRCGAGGTCAAAWGDAVEVGACVP